MEKRSRRHSTPFAAAPEIPKHTLSFWDGEWWCTCKTEFVQTDVDALLHYNNAHSQRDSLRVWTFVAEED